MLVRDGESDVTLAIVGLVAKLEEVAIVHHARDEPTYSENKPNLVSLSCAHSHTFVAKALRGGSGGWMCG